jgi:23S rRNA (adenine2503-C2)-methyltransferase
MGAGSQAEVACLRVYALPAAADPPPPLAKWAAAYQTIAMPAPAVPAPVAADAAPEGSLPDAGQISLIGLERVQLRDALAPLGLPPFRVRQLWHWIYHRGVRDFAAMTTLGKDLRGGLQQHFTLARPVVALEQTSRDATRKWLLRFADGKQAETVFIPETDRGALCLSSQVGCTLTCAFCHTGTQPLVRNLTAGEIVGQLLLARDSYGEWPTASEGRLISNIVLMGMGEPLFNYDSVAAALRIAMDPEGIAISRRRITLSTAGVVPLIPRVGAELGVKLAVSLHAPTDELRDRLVPLNRKYPIAELMAACRGYPGADNARRITFEYVMLKGVNDSPTDARALARLVAGIPCKFNLIPFNAWPGSAFECSSADAMTRFAQILNDAGYTAPIRTPRGRDIMAACGQLKSASERLRRARAQPMGGDESAAATASG